MNTAATPNLQDLVHASISGVMSRTKIAEEAKRQAHDEPEKCSKCSKDKEKCSCGGKMASAGVSTAQVTKLAGALDYLADVFSKTATENKPGSGPGALQVTEATASTSLPDHKGQATSKNVVPMHPGEEKVRPTEQSATALATNDKSPPGAGGKTPEKVAADLAAANIEKVKAAAATPAAPAKVAFSLTEKGHALDAAQARLRERHAAEELALLQQHGVHKGGDEAYKDLKSSLTLPFIPTVPDLRHAAYTAKQHESGSNAWNPLGGFLTPSQFEGPDAGAFGLGTIKKEKTAETLYRANLERFGLKLAEDAINPAHISAGPAQPPQTSASGQPGGEPAGGAPKGPTSALASNEAAIGLTRGEAYANRKEDMKKWLSEPMDSSKHDSTLQVAFDETSKADPKIGSAQSVKTAAARAILEKMAEKVS